MTDQQFAIFLTFIGLIFGAFITYYFNERQKPKKSAHFFIKDFDLISRNILNNRSEVEIRFHGLLVDELRIAKFFVWNSGDIPLRGSDVSGGDKLKILVPHADQISMLEVHESRSRVDVKMKPIEGGISIDFDTLDSGDFFTGRFFYSARMGAEAGKDSDPKLSGSIAGIPSGIKNISLEEHFEEYHWTGKIRAFSILAASILFVGPVYASFETRKYIAESDIDIGWIGYAIPYVMAFSGMLMLFFAVLHHLSWRRIAQVKVPAELRKFLKP